MRSKVNHPFRSKGALKILLHRGRIQASFCIGGENLGERCITSVGIDLGTSTTKFIASRLVLARVSGRTAVPKYQIVERKLIYQSPIYTTPLISHEEIDVDRVMQILQKEYERAQLSLTEIKTGAVIITGETATKKNAQQILHYLAERAGDFVVATAGADLEAVLAGKGSGAYSRSLNTKGTIANIDIGGGTANVVLFQSGKIVGTVTFHIGGRLIRLNQQGQIQYVSPHIRKWLEANGYRIDVGERVSFSELEEITAHLNRRMLNYLNGKMDATINHIVLGRPLDTVPAMEEILISGGVGQLMNEKPPETLEEVARYGDMGPILAHTLKEESKNFPFRVQPAEQTTRATVIGAGMENVEISGSTVFLDESLLPIRNLPVCKIDLSVVNRASAHTVTHQIRQSMALAQRMFARQGSPPFAIALTGISNHSFANIQMLASELAQAYQQICPDEDVMVVVCEQDIAKALGQALSMFCNGKMRIVCIDQVLVDQWDYIDLGEPIANTMIPVIIKSLAFAT
jgi:ethanolamine utilization protein EutA